MLVFCNNKCSKAEGGFTDYHFDDNYIDLDFLIKHRRLKLAHNTTQSIKV